MRIKRTKAFIFLMIAATLCANEPDFSNVRKMAEKQLKETNPKSYEVYKQKMSEAVGDFKKANRTRIKIFYLTSETVPPEHFIKIASEAAATGLDVEVQPLLRGIGNDLVNVLNGYRRAIENLPQQKAEGIAEIGVSMKIAPTFFQELHADRVPVIAIAKCTGSAPNSDDCSVKLVGRGTTTLMAIAIHSGSGQSAEELLEAAYAME